MIMFLLSHFNITKCINSVLYSNRMKFDWILDLLSPSRPLYEPNSEKFEPLM